MSDKSPLQYFSKLRKNSSFRLRSRPNEHRSRAATNEMVSPTSGPTKGPTDKMLLQNKRRSRSMSPVMRELKEKLLLRNREAHGSTMRLKQVESNGPLHVQHNGNENALNRYHRELNNVITTTSTDSDTTTTGVQELYNEAGRESVRRRQETLQWCNTINTIQHQQQRDLSKQQPTADNNYTVPVQHQQQQHRSLYNINNNVAASGGAGACAAPSPCSEYSPDDSLIDYEVEAQQSCSSIDTSPQDEDRGFDLSDSESLSDDGNISGGTNHHLQSRGIVNPNYPGFQHLAHTLDYTIKACSDTDFTDDDLDLDADASKLNCDVNNINNNNNECDTEYKIDSVNRLDSVENIQKVFYDKPKLNIPLEFDLEKQNNCLDSTEEASCSNLGSDEDLDGNILQDSDLESNENVPIKLNIIEESIPDIIGDFEEEIEQEIGRIVNRAIEQNLEEAIEKLTVAQDLSPSALKYNIEPNSDEPFEKVGPEPKTITFFEPTTKHDEKAFPESVLLDELSCELLQPIKEMAEIKIARVTSTEALTLKMNQKAAEMVTVKENFKAKTADAFLSSAQENLDEVPLEKQFLSTNQKEEKTKINTENAELPSVKKLNSRRDSNREIEDQKCLSEMEVEELEKFCKEDKTKDDNEKDEDSAVPRKKEKMELNYVKKRRDSNQQIASLITIPRRELGGRSRENLANRRSVPATREKKRPSPEVLGGFDVYNIETAMPKIDLDAIETHLRAAREEERRKERMLEEMKLDNKNPLHQYLSLSPMISTFLEKRRTDREEIRRRLAMGSEEDYYNGCERPGRKPSLQARLQSGMNLQICFMNETASDTDSPNSDTECSVQETKLNSLPIKVTKSQQPYQRHTIQPRPVSLPLGIMQPLLQPFSQPLTEADFFERQARLQTEARMALAQAKEMAHMQMEVERQRQKKSPITEMVRSSLEKVGIPFPEERRRVSRQILTEMNVAQLQVIVNDLHTQIETLNENLVRFLMNRDDLHMEQDSMLVDIEDLTRYLGAKEQTVKEQKVPAPNNNIPPPSPAPASPLASINNSVKPRLHRIASFVKK